MCENSGHGVTCTERPGLALAPSLPARQTAPALPEENVVQVRGCWPLGCRAQVALAPGSRLPALGPPGLLQVRMERSRVRTIRAKIAACVVIQRAFRKWSVKRKIQALDGPAGSSPATSPHKPGGFGRRDWVWRSGTLGCLAALLAAWLPCWLMGWAGLVWLQETCSSMVPTCLADWALHVRASLVRTRANFVSRWGRSRNLGAAGLAGGAANSGGMNVCACARV
jgi:hypothetical protein